MMNKRRIEKMLTGLGAALLAVVTALPATAQTTFDLRITKTDGLTATSPGQTVTYTIVVTNAGPSTATNATVADTFPAALSGVTFTSVTGGGMVTGNTAMGNGNISDTVTMPSGSTITYTATGTVVQSPVDMLTNTATVTAAAGETDTNLTNNSATDNTSLPVADLSITKDNGATAFVPGGQVQYTIVVTNNSDTTSVIGATVTDTFPAALTGVTYTSTVTGGATGNTAAGMGNIADTVTMPNESTITYTATGTLNAAATGTLANTATVAVPANMSDPEPSNDSATDTDTLVTRADLQIAKSDSADPVLVGATFTYTLTVTNNGPNSATSVTVTDTLPTGLTFVSGSVEGSPVTFANGVVTANVGTIAPSATATVTILVTADAVKNLSERRTNMATVSSATIDRNEDNDTATQSTTVQADADGDGTADVNDGCPNDPAKTAPGACGCGNPETDSDNDGTPDCVDGCPSDPAKTAPGSCGCGNPETDANGNGVADCVEPSLGPCPDNMTVLAADANGVAVDFTLPTGSSLLGDVTVTSDPAPGPVMPVGTTTVTVTVTDVNGVTASCTFDVTVLPPAEDLLQALLALLTGGGNCGLGVAAAVPLTMLGLVGTGLCLRRRRRN